MAALAFVGVAVTSATVIIYGEAIWDPVKLTERMGGLGVILALVALVLATITTNLAANVVAPANGFSNLSPRRISFKMGGYITAGIGIAIPQVVGNTAIFHLAGRLFGAAGSGRRHHAGGLLFSAQDASGCTATV
jgi:hypothetical protein